MSRRKDKLMDERREGDEWDVFLTKQFGLIHRSYSVNKWMISLCYILNVNSHTAHLSSIHPLLHLPSPGFLPVLPASSLCRADERPLPVTEDKARTTRSPSARNALRLSGRSSMETDGPILRGEDMWPSHRTSFNEDDHKLLQLLVSQRSLLFVWPPQRPHF